MVIATEVCFFVHHVSIRILVELNLVTKFNFKFNSTSQKRDHDYRICPTSFLETNRKAHGESTSNYLQLVKLREHALTLNHSQFTMLHYTINHYTILHYTLHHCTMVHYIIQHYTIPITLYTIILCSIKPYTILTCSITPHTIVLFSMTSYTIIPYSITPYTIILCSITPYTFILRSITHKPHTMLH